MTSTTILLEDLDIRGKYISIWLEVEYKMDYDDVGYSRLISGDARVYMTDPWKKVSQRLLDEVYNKYYNKIEQQILEKEIDDAAADRALYEHKRDYERTETRALRMQYSI